MNVNNIIWGHTTRDLPLAHVLQTVHHIDRFPFVMMNQVHGARSVVINNESFQFYQSMQAVPHGQSLSQAEWFHPIVVPNTDALITSEPDIILAVKMADCLPVILVHPYPLVSVIHAGRKGTEKQIVTKTIKRISRLYGVNSGIQAWLGPCICKSCYQIDPIKDLHFDLVESNRKQLLESGCVQSSDISIYSWCTSCQHDRFYSYRRGDKTDRNVAFVMIAEKLRIL